jgi:Flp pilus assembly protein TadD
MELRFLERRISESPRVYRAGAKSSIGFWARQVCALGRNRSVEFLYDGFVRIVSTSLNPFLALGPCLKNILLATCLTLALAVLGHASAQNQQSITVSDTEQAEVHLGKGYEALKQERYADAATEFRMALKIDPTLVMRARFPLAVALFEDHKGAEARHELETVRQKVGGQPSVCYYFGRLDLEEQKYKSAVANLNKAIANPPFPDTAFYLGFAYFKDGNDHDAEKWLKEAVSRNPDDSRAQYQLAVLYRKEGREQEAQQAFSRTKAQREQSDKLSQLKWNCAKELDRRVGEQALTVCEQLYNPDDAEMLATLGILYGQHGELEKALKPLLRAAELEPQSPQMQYNLAFTYYRMGRFADARAPLAGALERWPDLFLLNALYGAVLWQLGEAEPAYQVLKRAHRLNADDASTTDFLYTVVLELAKKSEESASHSQTLDYLKEAAALKPSEPQPHEKMALIYSHTGHPDQARAEQQKLNQLTKSSNN